MVELVRAGRNAEELAREFQTTSQSIRNLVAQADRDEGRRNDGLSTAEREELGRLGARIASCAKSARSWPKPRPGSPPRPARCRHGVPIRECESGQLWDRDAVPGYWASPPSGFMHGGNGRRRRAAARTRNSALA